MPARFIDRFSTSTFARSIALLLTVLMTFPDGVAMAQSCGSGSWTTSSSTLPNPIETLGAVVNNGYLYVVGGYTQGATLATGTFRNTVDYVPLSTTDGSLTSTFALTSAQLPVPLSRDLCGVAYKGFLYAVGGVESTSGTGYGTTTKAVRRGNIVLSGANAGDVNGWTSQTTALNTAVQLHGVAAMTVGTTGYMYVIGGSTGADIQPGNVTGNITNLVQFAKINSDGSVQSFSPTTAPLPIPLYKTCPVVVNGTIYMLGGETDASHEIVPGDPAVNTVYYATPVSSGPNAGDITSWTKAPYTIPLFTSSASGLAAQAVVYVNTKGIVFMGGDTTGNGGDTDVVLKGSSITGTSITWTYPPTLPATPPQNTGKTSRNAGATLNHYAYSIAGLYQGSDTNVVNCLLLP